MIATKGGEGTNAGLGQNRWMNVNVLVCSCEFGIEGSFLLR